MEEEMGSGSRSEIGFPDRVRVWIERIVPQEDWEEVLGDLEDLWAVSLDARSKRRAKLLLYREALGVVLSVGAGRIRQSRFRRVVEPLSVWAFLNGIGLFAFLSLPFALLADETPPVLGLVAALVGVFLNLSVATLHRLGLVMPDRFWGSARAHLVFALVGLVLGFQALLYELLPMESRLLSLAFCLGALAYGFFLEWGYLKGSEWGKKAAPAAATRFAETAPAMVGG